MTGPGDTSLRVWIDPQICIGSGNCVRLADGVFTMGDDGVARVVDAAGSDAERLRLAERSCPTGAIFTEQG
jgi:ferredoxin